MILKKFFAIFWGYMLGAYGGLYEKTFFFCQYFFYFFCNFGRKCSKCSHFGLRGFGGCRWIV